jgi:lipid-A-disaccharide synthase
MGPLLFTAFKYLKLANPTLRGTILFPDKTIAQLVSQQLQSQGLTSCVQLHDHTSRDRILEISGALMSSGTASLQVSLAGIPGVVVYRAHPLTYWLGKAMIRVPHLAMANILLKRPLYSEFIQSTGLQAYRVAQTMQNFFDEPVTTHQLFAKAAQQLNQILSTTPDISLSQWILTQLPG